MAASDPKKSKALILVADDDPELVGIVELALVDRGYRVVTANNGQEALERVEQEVPQLILLDMTMPVMDGWTFARRLRDKFGRGIPIVVMTAVKDSQLRSDEVGAEAELGKPFELSELYDTVADAIGSEAA